LRFLDRYSATYGSLGAAIVVMLWLYLFSAAERHVPGHVHRRYTCAPHSERGYSADNSTVPLKGRNTHL
jgi:hypothetical protein